jgi:hypothetical protein
MEYRGLAQTYHELMIRLHTRSIVIGTHISASVLTDPRPGTIDEKISRAMEEYFSGTLSVPAIGTAAAAQVIEAAEPARRGPGRPRKVDPSQNGRVHHDQAGS